MNTKKWMMTVCLALMTMGMQATNYYCSPTGTGDGKTPENPGALRTMMQKLYAGDCLYMRDGVYEISSTVNYLTRNGNANNYITICAYENEKPIWDFRNQPNGSNNNGWNLSRNYVHVKGLTIRYAGYKGIQNTGSYNILENMEVYGCCDTGIQHKTGGHNLIINCDSHENFDYQANGGNADGFADKQYTGAGNIYIGCRAWGNSDDGWDSFQRVTDGTPTVYINCITYNNGPEYFDLSAHPRVLGKDADLPCFVDKDLSHFANGGNPNGFKLGGQGTKHDTELYRCLAVGHRSKGFDQNNNAGNMKVINCTSYKNKHNYGFGNSYAYTLVIKNCISLSPLNSHFDKYPGATITDDHNTWNTGFSASESDFEGLDIESVINAPRNADGSLTETIQFHLKSTSTNLIDKGVNYTDFGGEKIADYVFYKGTAPDLGCYEYDPSTGISAVTVKGADLNPNMPRYNVRGQQVDSQYKGLVIQGGRKYIQK